MLDSTRVRPNPEHYTDRSRAGPQSHPDGLEEMDPDACESCWQAMAFTTASKTLGKQGGRIPTKRSASASNRSSPLARRVEAGKVDPEPEGALEEATGCAHRTIAQGAGGSSQLNGEHGPLWPECWRTLTSGGRSATTRVRR